MASSPFRWDGKTTASSLVQKYRGGLRSAISYLGIKSIEELNPDGVEFIRITNNGYQEGTAHGV